VRLLQLPILWHSAPSRLCAFTIHISISNGSQLSTSLAWGNILGLAQFCTRSVMMILKES
jgi:hypothetical protein